jgi:hypothetical protein
MKRAAAYFTCTASGHAVEEVYAKILAVAGDARGCYDHDAVAGILQADFATMMFQDACFLLQYIRWTTAAGLLLDALMAFMPANVGEFISYRAMSFEARWDFGNMLVRLSS